MTKFLQWISRACINPVILLYRNASASTRWALTSFYMNAYIKHIEMREMLNMAIVLYVIVVFLFEKSRVSVYAWDPVLSGQGRRDVAKTNYTGLLRRIENEQLPYLARWGTYTHWQGKKFIVKQLAIWMQCVRERCLFARFVFLRKQSQWSFCMLVKIYQARV